MNCDFCEKIGKIEKIKGFFLLLVVEIICNVPVFNIIYDKISFIKIHSLFFEYSLFFILAMILFHDTLISCIKNIKNINPNPIAIAWGSIVASMVAIAIILDKCGVNNYNEAGLEIDATKQIFILHAITVIFLGPIVEELIYRFFIFRTLREYNVVMAHIVTSLLFAFSHVGIYVFLYKEPILLFCMLTYIPLGIGTSILYDKNKNLLYPIILHMALNAFAALG